MKKILTIFILISAVITAVAQNTIRVEAPNVVGLDEQFNITFIIEGEDKPYNFVWEAGDDFQLVWGPQEGTSKSIQIINGKRSKSSQHTYTYILAPKKIGSFSLRSARVDVDGKTISSGNIVIQVVSNGNSSQGSSRNAPQSSSGRVSSSGEISKDDLFLRFSLSKSNAFIGEPLTAVLKLYQRVDIAGFEGAKFPTFNGFWSQETEAPSNIEFKRETFDDKIYNTAILRRYMLIPQQSGELIIEPAELVCLVNLRTGVKGSSSIFDSFFENDYTTVRKRITTPQITLHVNKLPQGAPASFGGGVGSFSINAKLNNDALKTHEATSLIVTVSGRGNVSLLEAPKVSFPPDMEVYDTKATANTDKVTGGTVGSKTFEYPFIPRSPGDFTIAPIEYSYFDVSSGKYVAIKTNPITIKVTKGKEEQTSMPTVSMPSTDRKGVKNLGEDIRFIKTRRPALKTGPVFFVGTPLFFAIVVLLFAGAGVCFLVFRKMAAMRSDVAGTKNRRATKMALKRLKQAEVFLKEDANTAFYAELHKAILGFVSDKLNIQVEDLNKDNISSELEAGGVRRQLIDRFVNLLDACDYSRYSPDTENKSMAEHYSEALELISSIDMSMKNKKSISLKTLALLPLFFMICGQIYAEQYKDVRDSLWNAGVEAYSSGSWEKAIDAWTILEKAKLKSPSLYYNIGNAYFKAGEYSKAILNYERVLKMDPSHSDSRYNLELASEHIQDRIDEVPEFILVSWARRLSYVLSSNTWAVLSLVFLGVFLAMLLLFLIGQSSGVKKTGFYTGIVALSVFAVSLSFSVSQKRAYLKADTAIVLKPVTSVRSSPSSESAKDLFVLHEGTKVRIIDKVGEWSNIELADGRQGWMLSQDMEVI